MPSISDVTLNLSLLTVSLATLGYLLFALLFPERF